MITSSRHRVRAVAICVAALLCAHTAAGATLDRVRALYASASYDAALQELDQLDAPASGTADAQQLRLLLLLALGRSADAGRVAEALVTASPTLVPSTEEFPPRYVSLITETRHRLLPQIIVQTFAEARAAYDAPSHGDAAARFKQVLALANDPAVADVAAAKDVRTLATGFLDLLRATDVPAPAGPSASATRRTAASAAPTSVAPPVTEPSVAIRQVLPTLPVSERSHLAHDVRGSIALVIGTDGRVKRATIQRTIHPVYDMMLLAASRDWLYKPAQLNGQPVESERILEVELKKP